LASAPSGRCTKVEGGWLALTVTQVLLPWWLYAEKHLQLLDVRVWFACAEMRERRRFTEEGREPSYKLAEVVKLVGGKGLSRIRASLKRLRDVGLIQWDGKTLELAASPDQVKVEDLTGFWEMLELVQNNRRKVPVPRRIVRFIAGGASRAETATILGHLLRCSYLRGGGVDSVGNCTSTWVAEVFGVNGTRVKQARARLVRLGMFIEHDQEQWHRNRYGSRIEVNLQWSRETPATVGEGAPGTTQGTESRPPVAVINNQRATPYRETGSLPTEGSKNQNPGGEAPKTQSGSSKKTNQKAEELKAPSLVHVVDEDLRNTERLLVLHGQATERGLVPTGERGELEFVALAEHARVYATTSSCALFVWLVHHYSSAGKRFVNGEDEEAARRRLREHRFGSGPEAPSKGNPREDSSPVPVGALLTQLLGQVEGRGMALRP